MTVEFPVATSPAPGVIGVDWESRVDFERLRQHRLARTKQLMQEEDLGALLLFETSNIRYATSTQIGYWAFNKGERWALVTRQGRPRIWDFGSAAKAHRIQLPHMFDTENSIGGNTGLQGAIGPEAGLHLRAAREVREAADVGRGDERGHARLQRLQLVRLEPLRKRLLQDRVGAGRPAAKVGVRHRRE